MYLPSSYKFSRRGCQLNIVYSQFRNRSVRNRIQFRMRTGPDVIKLVSCSTQLSMKFVLLKNLKFLTIAKSFLQNIADHEIFSDSALE